MEQISVIVPTLNEAGQIGQALKRLVQLPVELIVVDGGSSDTTVEIVRGFDVARLICTTPGRGVQMNAGAAVASGDVLLFLHADTLLPKNALRLILEAVANKKALEKKKTTGKKEAVGKKWGWFNVRLDHPSPMLRLVGYLISLRSRITATPTGDMAIFVARNFFREIGGYSPIPLMEDLDLVRRLKKHHRGGAVAQTVITSARRWLKDGVFKTIIRMWSLRILYYFGVNPETLVRWYADTR